MRRPALVGEPPYTGSTPQAILGKIIQAEPVSATKTRRTVPANVDAGIRRALEKVPADRFRTANELAAALGDPRFRHRHAGEAAGATVGADASPWNRLSLAMTVIATLFATLAGWMVARDRAGVPAGAQGGVARFALSFPDSAHLTHRVGVSLAVSPDNARIVYVGPGASGEGTQIWRRALDQLEAEPIPGTEDGISPVFSPDGASLAFHADEAIKTISLSGGPAVTVATGVGSGTFTGLDWGPDGMLYYNAQRLTLRVPATGGQPDTLPGPEAGDGFYNRVEALEGGGFLSVWQRPGVSKEIVGTSADGETRVLFPGLGARYAQSGHVVYFTADLTLMAVPFDARRMEVTGSPVALPDRPGLARFEYAQFALSDAGSLAYASVGSSKLISVARDGAVQELESGWTDEVGPDFALSPDGASVAVSMATPRQDTRDIYIKRLGGGPLQRLTFEGMENYGAAWTPDGQFVSFVSNRAGSEDLWMTRADGTGVASRLAEGVVDGTWSQDGSWLIVTSASRDILAMRVGVDTIPRPVIATDLDERGPALSPDGRWIAYTSAERGAGGRRDLFVRPFPDTDAGRWQISVESNAGGAQWSRTGEELFYRFSTGGGVAVVQVTTSPTFQAGIPQVLFQQENVGGLDVFPDDARFVLRGPVDASGSEPDVILVQNFFEELRQRVGGDR